MDDITKATVLLNEEQVNEYLQYLYTERDKGSTHRYLTVSPSLNESIQECILKNNNNFKARIEEIAWMKYQVSTLWKDKDKMQAIESPIDIAKIVAVYWDYEWNQITIDDLFNSKIKTW